MPKFSFVSFQQPGHMDFGGNSFIKMAQELIKRGHQVEWVFSKNAIGTHEDITQSILDESNVKYCRDEYYLTLDHHDEDIEISANRLAERLSREHVDCIVCDRLCVGVEIAAVEAKIPWVVIGTDGREWARRKKGIHRKSLWPMPEHEPKSEQITYQRGNFQSKSYWATSPYLNFSFFPKSYYSDLKHVASIPTHTHCVGGHAECSEIEAPKVVLLTFGNTFFDPIKLPLVKALLSRYKNSQQRFLILTGNQALTDEIDKLASSHSNFITKTWMDYNQAYANALISIGHGGSAHVWHGMAHGVPLVTIPSVGDQLFGGYQVQRMQLGYVIYPKPQKTISKLLPRGLRHYLVVNKTCRAVDKILQQDKYRNRAKEIQTEMHKGGGYRKAVSMLEELIE